MVLHRIRWQLGCTGLIDLIILNSLSYRKGWQPGKVIILAAWEICGFSPYLVAARWPWPWS